MHRWIFLALVLLGSAACAPGASTPIRPASSTRSQPDIPKTSVDRVGYGRPRDYLALTPGMGSRERIRSVAKELERGTQLERLVSIDKWVRSHLKLDPSKAYRWRNFDEIVADGTYGGCADHSLIFGALTRAVGIPTVWVKTMDADWIREFARSRGHVTSWRGHVFLEVFIDQRWMLLDATTLELYRDYDPKSRVLPGNRLAYDKGADPRELVLSTDWGRWKKQTREAFLDFDLAKLPVAPGVRLGRSASAVFIIADSPIYKWVARAYSSAGFAHRFSFNTDFDRQLERARRGVLVVTVVDDHFSLPDRYWPKWTGITQETVTSTMRERPAGSFSNTVQDGTRTTVLYARTAEEMERLVNGLEIAPDGSGGFPER